MYWFKSFTPKYKLVISVLFCISGLASCQPDVHESAGSKRYFDLAGFIKSHAVKLKFANPPLIKTVVHNNSIPQTKSMNIHNWEQELNVFTASDINKPAWRDSYRIQTQGDSTVYTAILPELITRRIAIHQTNGQVTQISVNNYTKNLLYQTQEHLLYYPDSLYIIDKLQRVKVIGSNRYLIKGLIK